MIKQSNYIDSYIKQDAQDSLDLFADKVPFLKGALYNIKKFTDQQLKVFVQLLKAFPYTIKKYQERVFGALDDDKSQLVNHFNMNESSKLYSYEQLAAFEFDVSTNDLGFLNPWEHLQQIQSKHRWSKRGLSLNEKGKLQFDANIFATYVLGRLELVQTEFGEIFRYNEQGVYVPLKENVLKSLCRKILNGAGESLWRKNLETEYIAALKNEIPFVFEFDPNPSVINFLNGLFNLETMQLRQHSSDYYSINQLQYKYIPSAKCPRFEKFLNEVFEDDIERKQLIQEIMGYLWLKEIKMQKAFIFIGKGSNGKSVLSKTIRKLVGEPNVSSVGLKKLQDRFGLQEFPGKLVNISGENEFSGDFTTENFKLITSGDSLSVEKKNKDSYTTTIYTKLIILLNKMMDCRDTTDAFLRRLTIVPFNKKFVELKQGELAVDGVAYMDPNLEKILEDELPGIFNFSMQGLQRLFENDFKMTSSRVGDNALEDYKRNQNHVISYIADRIQFKEGTRVIRSTIYDDYRSWCKENSI
ncbi:phage/plasmid primase, P4 family [Bacillus paramycoides]|uniref:DNA primase family protein n=1 Tax=Bacillus paramycoides TaxID=2026194 RepID=UPI002E1B7B4E|nr:phage/plasmid primase, P4 family [Bacillus paramycoides]MED0968185.1 phage/plasmid primase, P4 family [Bacillus paramycoides]